MYIYISMDVSLQDLFFYFLLLEIIRFGLLLETIDNLN